VLAGGLPGVAVAGRQEVLSLIEFRDSGRSDFARRIPHPGTFNANPLSAAAGGAALEVAATGEAQRHAEALCRALVRGLNQALAAEGVPGCAYGLASMFHMVLGAECPPPVDGFAWDWQGRPGDQMPRMSGEVASTLRRGMINEGVDLMDTAGMLSIAHTEEDVAHTLQAFRRTLRQMKEEGAL
jgi:glutamate-1-semialdehyde 2,1-aminomutase